MIHETKMFILVFLFFLNVLHGQQIWLVKFPHKDNYVSKIEKLYPFIDLLQNDNSQSSFIYLIPNNYLSNFARFIHQSNGYYQILSDNTWKKSRIRSKRWTPSDNPLDKTYHQHFLSYDEQQTWYDLLANSPLTKNSVHLHTIGHTYENRSLTVVQIHSTPLPPRNRRRRGKYAVFIDGGMHAREWLSIGVANYLLIQFLTLKETNIKVREILRHFDIYILPIMNPDGYEYSRTEDRLWRKNRSPTSHSEFWNGMQSCYGADLNRNFPHQWNNTYGSSTHACSHSYRGPKPSSENEVRSVVNFLRKQKYPYPKFHVYFNLHAYGRFWLLPWTYSLFEQVSNYDDLLKRSKRIVSDVMNKTYKVGQASFLLYPCSGTSIDYAATLMPHAMTFELSPIFNDLPMCVESNKTMNQNCTIGFLSSPEAIEIDGIEIFNAIVEYLDSIRQDSFL
jgi:hypothetical protein